MASADFGAPAPIIDFQPPLSHTLVQANIQKKGTFEKMFLEGRPPVGLGVTSGGDFFGGTQVTFTDVLGDKQFNIFAASVSQYRTMAFSYIEPVAAAAVRAAGLLADAVLLRLRRRQLYGLEYGLHRSRPTRSRRRPARRHGVRHLPVQPLRAPRAVGGHAATSIRRYDEPGLQELADAVPDRRSTAAAVLRRQLHAARRHASSRKRRCSASTGRSPGNTLSPRLRIRAELRRLAVAADRRRRRALLHAARHQRRARVPRARLQELGRVPRLPLLRRQLRDARLRVPRVHRQQGVLRRTPSCASRSSRRRSRRSASSAACAACSSSTSAGAATKASR